MKTKLTSAQANKTLKQLTEEREYWLNKEKNSSIYTSGVNEEPVVPEYDYMEVANKIAEIDEKIMLIKQKQLSILMISGLLQLMQIT